MLDPQLWKALADPTRARLLSCLLKCGRPCSVTEIAACCALDFSTVTRHLATMARARLIVGDKRGRTVWYRADGPALATTLRALADAIDELGPGTGCCEVGGCGPGREARP